MQITAWVPNHTAASRLPCHLCSPQVLPSGKEHREGRVQASKPRRHGLAQPTCLKSLPHSSQSPPQQMVPLQPPQRPDDIPGLPLCHPHPSSTGEYPSAHLPSPPGARTSAAPSVSPVVAPDPLGKCVRRPNTSFPVTSMDSAALEHGLRGLLTNTSDLSWTLLPQWPPTAHAPLPPRPLQTKAWPLPTARPPVHNDTEQKDRRPWGLPPAHP